MQARLPGREWRSKEFKDKWGTAGVSLDQRRKSPIVEISQLLVCCLPLPQCQPFIVHLHRDIINTAADPKCQIDGCVIIPFPLQQFSG